MTSKFESLESRKLLLRICLAASSLSSADAASIAYNFTESDSNPSQALDSTTPKGPLGTTVWNDSYVRTSGTVANGSESALVDGSGAVTTAAITWSSKETWFGDGGGTTQDQRIVLGYLDDGDQGGANPGVFITITGIPYAAYNVYGIVASDAGSSTTYTTQDFLINAATWVYGGGAPLTATAFANQQPTSANGTWSEIIPGSQTGNYWLMENVTGGTLTIDGQIGGGGARGSLAGIIIEEVPEPSVALLSLLAGGALLVRRSRIRG
jgi:hypothetical protein